MPSGYRNDGSFAGIVFAKDRPPWNKGGHWTEEQRQKLIESHTGKKLSEQTKIKMCESAHKGKEHQGWKGENASYVSIHKWVRKWLGRPKKCEMCGKDNLTSEKIDWANKDHQYRRNLSDWLRLCKKCHRKYDISKNQWVRRKNK